MPPTLLLQLNSAIKTQSQKRDQLATTVSLLSSVALFSLAFGSSSTKPGEKQYTTTCTTEAGSLETGVDFLCARFNTTESEYKNYATMMGPGTYVSESTPIHVQKNFLCTETRRNAATKKTRYHTYKSLNISPAAAAPPATAAAADAALRCRSDSNGRSL